MSTKKLQILGALNADTLDGLHAADLENEVYAAEESVDTSAEVINADTLGGVLAKDYATKDDLNVKSQVQIITWEADD